MATTEPGQALARVAPELDTFARLGKWLAAAESGDKTPEALGAAASLRFALANQLGLTPFTAFELSFIKGQPYVSAKLIRALANQAGYRVLRQDDSAESCTAVLVKIDTGEELGRTTYTMADAKTAGLVRDGSGYKTNPARMLWARASKRVVDDYAPGISLGLMTEEEAVEVEAVELPPDDFVDVTPQEPAPTVPDGEEADPGGRADTPAPGQASPGEGDDTSQATADGETGSQGALL
jgi:hypothetical protein